MQVTRVYITDVIMTQVTAKSTAVPSASSEKSLTPSCVVSPPNSSKMPAKAENTASIHFPEVRMILLSDADENPKAFCTAIPAPADRTAAIPRSILFDLNSPGSPFKKAFAASQSIKGNKAHIST